MAAARLADRGLVTIETRSPGDRRKERHHRLGNRERQPGIEHFTRSERQRCQLYPTNVTGSCNRTVYFHQATAFGLRELHSRVVGEVQTEEEPWDDLGLIAVGISVALGASVRAAEPGAGRDAGAADLARRTIERRAVEAVIWGMPAVNYDLMLQEMLTKTKGKINQVVYWSRPLDWKNQTLTPNPDAIYLMTFFNTKDVGPVVIEVPPADGGSLAANIDNVWQVALEDAGPEGADKGEGGKYLILPPDYTGKPPEGYIALQSDTYGGFALLRSNLETHSDADAAKSVAYGKRVKIYPLVQAANPAPTTFTDAMDVVFDSTIPYDLRFFRSLDRVVQSEPWHRREQVEVVAGGEPHHAGTIPEGHPFATQATLGPS